MACDPFVGCLSPRSRRPTRTDGRGRAPPCDREGCVARSRPSVQDRRRERQARREVLGRDPEREDTAGLHANIVGIMCPPLVARGVMSQRTYARSCMCAMVRMNHMRGRSVPSPSGVRRRRRTTGPVEASKRVPLCCEPAQERLEPMSLRAATEDDLLGVVLVGHRSVRTDLFRLVDQTQQPVAMDRDPDVIHIEDPTSLPSELWLQPAIQVRDEADVFAIAPRRVSHRRIRYLSGVHRLTVR